MEKREEENIYDIWKEEKNIGGRIYEMEKSRGEDI